MSSVQPYVSPFDPNPVSPNSSSTPGPASGPSLGNPDNIPQNVAVPGLAVAWTGLPPFVPAPAPPAPASGGPPQTINPAEDMRVDLAELRAAEQTMLDAAAPIVDAYNNLRTLFESVKDTVFGQQATMTTTTPPTSGSVTGGGTDIFNTPTTSTGPDPVIQALANAFANGTPAANGQPAQPGINDVQAYNLLQIANAMALLGQFIAAMNKAGVAYANADAYSAFPPLGTKPVSQP